MNFGWLTPPLKISSTYLVVSLSYIVLSDWLVEAGSTSNWLPGLQTVKGMVFVILSAILIHILTAREFRRRQALELQLLRAQRMEAVGQFTSGVAHDFNNFLTVILGNLELIHLDAEGNPELQRRAEQALHASERGADLTRRLLSFSRKQSVEPRLVDVNDCVAQMRMLLECVLGEGIRVKATLMPELPPIMADPGQLESAVLNLAINARDAMPNGGTVGLTTRALTLEVDQTFGKWRVEKGQYVVISVEDTGHGMSQQVQDQIATPFFTTKPSGEGTGLGFPMALRFVKQSGGHVTVKSDVSQGTCVTLYFPVATQAQQAPADASMTPPDAGGSETVLLLENDPAVRDILNDFLTRLGYRVLLASRPGEADRVLRGEAGIDVVITDIALGGTQNGIAFANDLRQANPEIPILLISGSVDQSVTSQLANPDRIAWLAKPFTHQTVARRLRDLIDG